MKSKWKVIILITVLAGTVLYAVTLNDKEAVQDHIVDNIVEKEIIKINCVQTESQEGDADLAMAENEETADEPAEAEPTGKIPEEAGEELTEEEQMEKWFFEEKIPKFQAIGDNTDLLALHMYNCESSFLLHVNLEDDGEVAYHNSYRNIVAKEMPKGWSSTMYNIADVVVDKYIREYGGEDTDYYVDDESIDVYRWEENGEEVDVSTVCCCDVYGGGVKLTIIHSMIVGIPEIVTIQGTETVQHQDEFIAYMKHTCDNTDSLWLFANDKYSLLLNPELKNGPYHYRNVDRSKGRYDELVYYIADQAINKYIIDFLGRDELYEISVPKQAEEVGQSTYMIDVKNEEVTLHISYSTESWVAYVEIEEEKTQQNID